MKNIVKYVGIILVFAGILLVMKNLFSQDTDWTSDKKNNIKTTEVYYNARIQLLDKDTNSFLTGATLVLKNESGEEVEEWTTDGGIHLVNKLKTGKYTIEETNAPEGYRLEEETVSFEIKTKDQEVTVYNTAMTEEEKEEVRRQNTISNEVGVENTLSEKNIWSILGGIISIGVGVGLILFQKKSSDNDV